MKAGKSLRSFSSSVVWGVCRYSILASPTRPPLEQGPDDGGDVRLVRVVVEAGKKKLSLFETRRRLESSSSGSISMLTVDSGARFFLRSLFPDLAVEGHGLELDKGRVFDRLG